LGETQDISICRPIYRGRPDPTPREPVNMSISIYAARQVLQSPALGRRSGVVPIAPLSSCCPAVIRPAVLGELPLPDRGRNLMRYALGLCAAFFIALCAVSTA